MEIKNLFTPEAQQFGSQLAGVARKVAKPLQQPIQELGQQFTAKVQPAIQGIQDTVNTGFVEPAMKPIKRNEKIGKVNKFIASKGITVDDIKNLAEADGSDPEEALQFFRDNGIKIEGMEQIQAQQQTPQTDQDWYNNKSYFGDQRKDEGVLEQAGKGLIRTPLTYAQNAISGPENIAQGSMNLLEKTLGEGALNPLLNVVGGAIKGDQYKPLPTWYNDVPSTNQYTENVASNIIGAGREALTTGKTYSQANEELKQQQYQAGKDQGIGGALSNIGGGAVSSAFNIMAPGASALFAGASEMPGTQYVTQGLGAITQKPIDYVVNKAGGTQDTAEQIGTMANLALPLGRNKIAGMKPTSKPGQILQKTAVGTADAITNPLGVVKKIVPTKEGIKNIGNNTAEALLLKQWKLDKKTRDTIKSQGEDNGAKFILERDLSKGNIEETADNVGAYKYSKMQEKLDAIDKFGDTDVPDVAINMAKKMQDRISNTIEYSYGKMTPEQTIEILNQNHPEYAKMYQFLSEVQGSKKTDFANLEKLKELYDATNPENLKWDIQNKPENQIAHDLVSQKRAKLQNMLEEEGVKRGVNIKEINKEIQKSTTVQRGLEKASSRRENLNMFGLGDSQTAIVSAILGGAPGAIGALLLKKGLENEGIRGTIAKKLYTKTPKNDIPMNNNSTNTTSQSRVGRIMNRNSDTVTPKVAPVGITPKGVPKVESRIPGSKKTTVETPMNPKGNESRILAKKQGVMVQDKGVQKLLPSGDRLRKEQVREVERELNSALKSNNMGNKPEGAVAFLDRNIKSGKITKDEAIGMLETLYKEANGWEKPHYERILNDMYQNKPTKVESFDDLLNGKKPEVKTEGPKTLIKQKVNNPTRAEYLRTNPKGMYENFRNIVSDKRYSKENVDQLIADFKNKTGWDLMKDGDPKFDADLNVIRTIVKPNTIKNESVVPKTTPIKKSVDKFARNSDGGDYNKMRSGDYHPELKKLRDISRKYELEYNKLDNDIGELLADEKSVPKSMMEQRVIAQKKMREYNGKSEDLFEEIKTYESNQNARKITPKSNAKQQGIINNTSDTIPEGYRKNALGEIVKKPGIKKGGFIKIPEIGKKVELNPIVNKQTGETLNQAIEKLRGYGWEESKIQKFKDTVLLKSPNKIIYPKGTITSVNPTSSLFVDYNPQSRMTAPLAKNIVTLDKTSGKSPDTIVTIYRGAPKNQKEINPGDFITTNYDLAKSYTNDEGVILSKKVKMSDILDDMEDPSWNGGEEYLYRPSLSKSPVKNPLVEEARKIPRSIIKK